LGRQGGRCRNPGGLGTRGGGKKRKVVNGSGARAELPPLGGQNNSSQSRPRNRGKRGPEGKKKGIDHTKKGAQFLLNHKIGAVN